MRRKQRYSVFNNFNKNYHEGLDPNYYEEYMNEFSEELFDQLPEATVGYNPGMLYKNDLGQNSDWSSQPRNGEYTDD